MERISYIFAITLVISASLIFYGHSEIHSQNLVSSGSANGFAVQLLLEMLIKANGDLSTKVQAVEKKIDELMLTSESSDVLAEERFENLSMDIETCLAKIEAIELKFDLAVANNNAVAFHARVSPAYADINPGQTIKFKDIITNIGNAYSSITGEFIAPGDGLYMFYVNLLTGNQRPLEAALLINGLNKLNIYCGSTPGHGEGSNSLVVHLNSGDKVYVVKTRYGNRPFYIHSTWSVFNGFLIRAD